MRDIKFRAWAGNPKSMRTVCELVDSSNYFQISTGYILGDVMQFTGLHDKNGKEIWEGDILRISYGIPPTTSNLEIIWFDAGWYMKGEYCSDYLKKSYLDDLEVIGNVHQDIHLLDEKSR